MRWGGYHTEASAVAEDAGLCGCVAWESNVERWCASEGSQGTPLMREVSGVHLVHVSHYLPRPLLGWIRDHPRLVAVGGSGRTQRFEPTISRPPFARFAPSFHRSFAVSGFLAPRRRERAKNGVKWAKFGGETAEK